MKHLVLVSVLFAFSSFAQAAKSINLSVGQSSNVPFGFNKKIITCGSKSASVEHSYRIGDKVYLLPGEKHTVGALKGMTAYCGTVSADRRAEMEEQERKRIEYVNNSPTPFMGHPTCEVVILAQNLNGINPNPNDPMAREVRQVLKKHLMELNYIVFDDYNAMSASSQAMTLKLSINRRVENKFGSNTFYNELNQAQLINANGSVFTQAINSYNYASTQQEWDKQYAAILGAFRIDSCKLKF